MSADNKQKPEVLSTKTMKDSPLFEIEQLELRFSNGAERTFYRVHSLMPSAVMIVPLLDDETFLLIREYGAGIDEYTLGFPKGALGKEEDVLAGADRELMEEVGYGSHDLTLLKTFSTSPGYMSSRMHLVVARDLYEKRLPGDEPEPIEVVPWKIKDIDQLLQRDDFNEARSVAALLMVAQGVIA
ncbi:MAG: ADP compounds hydrolase NudE [Coxiellaceae bacterium]|nr:ADP compounds hydrolase NudE [Coxiellaceae bacterium]